MTKHKQTQFITLDHRAVTVDEGLLPVLNELRRLGVRTQYSCQKDRKTAYILADRKTLLPVIKKINRMYENKQYSESTMEIVRRFRRGYSSHEFSWFKNHKIPNERMPAIETKFQRTISTGYHAPCRYSIEYLYSNTYGRRIVVRWPHYHTAEMLQLLKETDPMKELGSKEALPGINWEENRLSECKYGCKVYRQKGTGLEFVAHNSSYGCPK